MSEAVKPVVFTLNGKEVAKIGEDGKLVPAHEPKVRLDQIDNRSDIGKQACIVEKFGMPDEPKVGI